MPKVAVVILEYVTPSILETISDHVLPPSKLLCHFILVAPEVPVKTELAKLIVLVVAQVVKVAGNTYFVLLVIVMVPANEVETTPFASVATKV